MRNSLYDALEVDSSSSTASIQVALRTVVRRFWALPRDASGDSEEAIRFAALAASVLVDPVRRKDYDAALNPGVGMGPWRLPINSREGANEGGTNSRSLASSPGEVSQLSIVAAPPQPLPGVDALARSLPDGSAWRSPLCYVALALAGVLLWLSLLLPIPGWFDLGWGQALLATLGLIALAGLVAAWMSRPRQPPDAVAGLSRLAIIKWRREGSIFIGSPPPQHDTSWIFKLRLMELTRSAAGFVTSANPWRRLAARAVDYALIAVCAFATSVLIESVFGGLAGVLALFRSVLLLPTEVVLIAVPISSLLHRTLGTTPGKFLLSLQLISGVSRPADHAVPSDRALRFARAIRVAVSGSSLGFLPVALYRLPRHLRAARDTETDWEIQGDSVVMARPLTAPTVATALLILLAATLILFCGWRRDYVVAQPALASVYASVRGIVIAPFSSSMPPAQPGMPDGVKPQDVPDSRVSATLGAAATAASTATASVVTDMRRRMGLGESSATVAAAADSAAKSPVEALPSAPPGSSVDADMAKLAAAAQARRARIEGYARQADAARASNSFSGLQGVCQRWTIDQPSSADAWRCFGLAQFQSGAGREALPALRQALKLESRDPQVEAAILSILRP